MSDHSIDKDGILPPALTESIADCLRKIGDKGHVNAHLPAYFKTQSAREAFNSTFELVGGIPRFAHWADKNYNAFVALYSKLIPLTVAGDPDRPIKFEVPWLSEGRFAGMRGAVTVDQIDDTKQLSLFTE